MLYRKGKEAKLGYAGHLLIENGNGLAVSACVTPATGTAERDAALDFAVEISGHGRVTLGGDKLYDTHDFVKDLRKLQVTPHVAQNNTNPRHEGYQISQRKRKRIEEIFGWLKTVGLLRKLRHRGTARVNRIFIFATAAYKLVRMRKLVTVLGSSVHGGPKRPPRKVIIDQNRIACYLTFAATTQIEQKGSYRGQNRFQLSVFSAAF